MQLRKGEPRRREDLFGGRGEVLVWNLLTGTSAPPFTAVLSCELAPGGRVGRHRQHEFPEIVIGLGGRGEAHVGELTHFLGPGFVVHLPLGEVMSIVNLSEDEPLRYLIVKAKDGRADP